MKKIFIVLIFVFQGLLTFSQAKDVKITLYDEKNFELDFNMKLMMGLTRTENDSKYQKLVDYIDENLILKNKVNYTTNINLKKSVIEVFSENGDLLYKGKISKESTKLLSSNLELSRNLSLKFNGRWKERDNFFDKLTENVNITKLNGKVILSVKENAENKYGETTIIIENILKRELTESEKKELLNLKEGDLVYSYKKYMESESLKGYDNEKLEIIKEDKNLKVIFERMFEDNKSIKQEIEYTDSNRLKGVFRRYEYGILKHETFFEDPFTVLVKQYYPDGTLMTEIHYNKGEIDGELKGYYENGKLRYSSPYINGKKNGHYKAFDKNGNLTEEILYKNDKLVEEIVFENSMPNLQKSYHDNGNLAFEIPMKNGAINGEVKIYYENGKIKEIIPVKNGKKEGIGREYNETGEIIKEVLYKDDEEVKKIK